jgi:hypothetical protein
MSTKAKLFCSSLVLSLILMLPATVPAESAVPQCDKAKKLFEQIQGLELIQRTIEESYQAEKRTPMGACWSGQSWRDHTESPGKLMNSVFGHLGDTPEYERFIAEYRMLIQCPDYRRFHSDELFAEYLRLLESGRTRLMTQWKDLQKGLAEDGSDKLHEGLAQSIPMNTVTFGHAEVSQRAQSVRVVPAVRLQVQMPLSGSTPLAENQKSVQGTVVPGMDQSGSADTAAPTIDARYLNQVKKKNGPQIVDTKVGAPSETEAVDQILDMPIIPTTVGQFPYRPQYQGVKQRTLGEQLGTKTLMTPSPKKVAIPWKALKTGAQADTIIIDMDKSQLEKSPDPENEQGSNFADSVW